MLFLRYLMAVIMLIPNIVGCVFNDYAFPAVSRDGAYLFCYFVGNETEQQRIHLAVSKDGYNFEALNNNEPVIIQEKGKKCVRDPYIFKGQDGCYYIIGTDMNALEGWTSNHALVTWKSEDLVNWTDETIIDIRELGGEFANTTRAWAPQVIWDSEKEMYMVYWAHSTVEQDIAGHYYAYTKDMKTFETEPKPLYGREGIQCIDGDIIYNENDGYYYLYFKHDEDQTIAYVKSKSLTGPYDTEPVVCSLSQHGVEGSTMFNVTGTDAWIMLMDEYGTGHFFAQMTRDFKTFKALNPKSYKMDQLSPRHGSIVAISMEEYDRLVEHYGTEK